MAQAALISEMASAGFGAMGAMAEARAQKAHAERNAFIGRTRAIQTDTAERAGLNDELSTIRATLAANGQRGGAFEIMRALRETRGRERRVEVANRMQEAADWRMQGRNALVKGRAEALTELPRFGLSLFKLSQLRPGGPNG
ncbi:hypothetical protein [Paracoccus fontiphilus]|uniref:Uncharacterized protein n=1 Tax=Paracoccus fontiphilus TaxID=1815556 RepID=A0ABV7IDT9_9RHOB|nr:hypothetical protein [Paracoccus fontiphilus]